jgi:8-oxo-dGTP pyrophosphatase MutT (NUDIX family)
MMKQAYGGVIFDESGKVLLRRPSNGFDNTAWTFAKGKHEGRCSAEDTALREVKEETGYSCRIIGRVPGTFLGGTSINEYFLMTPDGEPGKFDWETEAVIWVSPEEAVGYIKQTGKEVARVRDLAVLEAAVLAYRALGLAKA